MLEPLKRFYAGLVGWGLDHRALVLIVFFGLFVFSAKQMPLVGRELMPLMDTGIFLVNFEAEPDTNAQQMQRIASEVDAAIRQAVPAKWLISSSTLVGSEPGVRAFGAARTFQQGQSTVNLVDRFSRDQSIYALEQAVRERVRAIPDLIAANVSEYGATPFPRSAAAWT